MAGHRRIRASGPTLRFRERPSGMLVVYIFVLGVQPRLAGFAFPSLHCLGVQGAGMLCTRASGQREPAMRTGSFVDASPMCAPVQATLLHR